MKEYFKLFWKYGSTSHKIIIALFIILSIIELYAGLYSEFFNSLILIIWVIVATFYQSVTNILYEDNQQKDEEIKNLRNLVQTIFKDVKK